MGDDEQENGIKDKRQADRSHLVFYLRVFEGTSRKILGHLVDISEQGIMLICGDPVRVDTSYRLRMSLPTQMKDHKEIDFSATCRWCKDDVSPDFYLVGFQLDDLKPVTRSLIITLMKDYSQIAQR